MLTRLREPERALPAKFYADLDLLDKMRQKYAPRELYDGMGCVPSLEALQALDTATQFVEDISKLLGL